MNPIFQLTSNNRVLATEDKPQDLDFSKLSSNSVWAVFLVDERDKSYLIAAGCFKDAPYWIVRINERRVDTVTQQRKVVPILRDVLKVWFWERCFDSEITIFPGG